MFITINGQLGSGKSAVCQILREQHGFSVFNTGRILRERANELGISVLELNEKAKEDFSLDHYIDNKTVEFAAAHAAENIIYDSRMAWYFVPGAFKVHLLVRPAVAAERVFFNRVGQAEETYASKEEAMKELIARRRSEAERYEMIYGVSMLDYSHYDLILDTSTLTPEEVTAIIVEECEKFHRGQATKTVVVSPQNLFPTKGVDALDPQKLAVCEAALSDGQTPAPIRIAEYRDSLFILCGHHWVAGCNHCSIGKIHAVIDTDVHDIPTTSAMVRQWEETNHFIFGYYPEEIR